MSDELETLAPGGVVNLSNAPAALDEATWDTLFPSNPPPIITQSQQTTTQPDGSAASNPSSTTNTQQQTDFFIKADKSVYKTADEAIKGINHKDELIERDKAVIDTLRQRYILATGIDPTTGQPVSQMQNQNPESFNDYTTNPKKYLEDLYKAANSNDPAAYAGVQQKLISDTLKPLQPIISQSVKGQALTALSTENAEAAKFVQSPVFQKTLDANPDLKLAISTAESDSRHYTRLPALYKLAYLAGQGMQLPELLKSATTNQTTTQNSNSQPAQVRTTIQPTTLSPGKAAPANSFKDIDSIKATIASMEGKGMTLDF